MVRTEAMGKSGSPQSYLWPADLFPMDGPGRLIHWTCVYTKPRWEKKLSRWLGEHRIPHFLPTVRRRTISFRKERVSELPLFPGYVFIAQEVGKRDLRSAEAVVSLVEPATEAQMARLHQELWNIWAGLTRGSHLELVRPLEEGQWVEVVAGPLKGIRGRFEKWGRSKRLILSVDLLHIGITVEVPDDCVVVPI